MVDKPTKPKKKRISVASGKNKGRTLQKEVVAAILRTFTFLQPDDVVNTSMGAPGEDVKLSPAARAVLPISIECKNVEKISIWAAWAQATANAKHYNPVLVFKKNHQKPLVVMTLDYFLSIHKDCDALAKLIEQRKAK